MTEVSDIVQKLKIYTCASGICDFLGFEYFFDIDRRNRETALIFNRETGDVRIPKPFEKAEDIAWPEKYKVPDVASRKNLIVFEYEEETGPRRTGAHMAKKGHGHPEDEYTRKDAEKYDCYKRGNVRYLRVWESEMKDPVLWRAKIAEFLIKCYWQDHTELAKVMEPIPDMEGN